MDDILKMTETKVAVTKIPAREKNVKITEKDLEQAKKALEVAERISQKVDFYKARRNAGNAD